MNIYNHTAGDRTPYTYLIGWSAHNKWYYGVRYAKMCHPHDFWISYFTSSKRVKEFVDVHGAPDVIQIRKIFNSAEQAQRWENKVIIKMNMIKDEKFLNRCHSKSIHPDDACKHSKGKTYEEIYGEERAQELKKRRSDSNRVRKVKYKTGPGHGNSTPWIDKVCLVCNISFKTKDINRKYCCRDCYTSTYRKT